MASSAQAKTFIRQIAPLIQRYSAVYGYKVASPIIAQACIESGFGCSSLGKKYHNYFGMKCGNTWTGKSVNLSTKEEYEVGTLTNIKANFRVYDSMEEGVRGYFDFIKSTRYANLKSATTPREYLEMIKKDGYATSSTYVATNMNVVTKYDLTKYDTEIIEDEEQEGYDMPTIKLGSIGKAVKIWQIIVNVNPDGIFGVKTKTATEQFQSAHKLSIDGVVGDRTWREGLESLK